MLRADVKLPSSTRVIVSAHAGPVMRHESKTQRSPSIRARARGAWLPETVQSQSGHECGGTFFVAVATATLPEPYAQRARAAAPSPRAYAATGFRIAPAGTTPSVT